MSKTDIIVPEYQKNTLERGNHFVANQKSIKRVSLFTALGEAIDTLTGVFRPSGLNTSWKITTVVIGDTAIKIPTAALNERNSLEIHNTDTAVTLYVGPDNTVTADKALGSTAGKEIPPESFWSIDITDAIDIYAICPPGQSAIVKIMEVA